MKKALVISGIACIVVGVAVLVLLSVLWFSGPDTGFAAGDMDRHFIEEMIPHHEDAVTMAELALTRAEHPELKQLAETIIRDQTREIEQMRTWYTSWYGVDAPRGDDAFRGRGMGQGMMGQGMMHDDADMEVLQAALVFDKEFIEQMIPHHDDAIEMAELALSRAEHPEIKQLAADIRTTQTAENTQMREWYGEWFGADVPETRDSSALMGGMMGAGVLDLEQLATAKPFDKAFIEAMIPHHRMGIMMSRMAGGMSGRPEMRQLTSSIIEAQGREIDEMQAWYDEWYGR